MDRPLLDIHGLGTGDISQANNTIELNLKLADQSEVRLRIQLHVLESLIFALQSLMSKLKQLNPKSALPGETLDVIPIEADTTMIGRDPTGRIGVRFESAKGMCPTILMSEDRWRKLSEQLQSEMAVKNRKGPPDRPH